MFVGLYSVMNSQAVLIMYIESLSANKSVAQGKNSGLEVKNTIKYRSTLMWRKLVQSSSKLVKVSRKYFKLRLNTRKVLEIRFKYCKNTSNYVQIFQITSK